MCPMYVIEIVDDYDAYDILKLTYTTNNKLFIAYQKSVKMIYLHRKKIKKKM